MKYTESHEWVNVENDTAIIGVTNHAQQELGEIVYVELPIPGKEVKAGEEVAVLESTKAAADVYSPLSGTILDVNQRLKQASELINTSPENEGWIFKIKLQNPKELEQLLDSSSYHAKFS